MSIRIFNGISNHVFKSNPKVKIRKPFSRSLDRSIFIRSITPQPGRTKQAHGSRTAAPPDLSKGQFAIELQALSVQAVTEILDSMEPLKETPCSSAMKEALTLRTLALELLISLLRRKGLRAIKEALAAAMLDAGYGSAHKLKLEEGNIVPLMISARSRLKGEEEEIESYANAYGGSTATSTDSSSRRKGAKAPRIPVTSYRKTAFS